MKILLPFLLLSAISFFCGCASTTNERISQNQALFNSYTPAEKKMIRTGQVGVGFDQDQVRMSLGAPSRETTIDTAAGKAVVWEYRELRPSMGVSVGGRVSTGGSGIGLGTGANVNNNRTRLLKRIIFDRQTGEVSRVESYN